MFKGDCKNRRSSTQKEWPTCTLYIYINDQPPDPPAGENVGWPHLEYRFYSDKMHALMLNYFQLSPDTW